MAIKMAEADLPHLLSWLEHHLPHSFLVHGELKHHLRGQFPDVNFFVDRWPDPQAVVARNKQLVKNKEAKAMTAIDGIFSLDDKTLSRLLWDPCLVDWKQCIVLNGVPESLMPELSAAAEDMGKSVSSCSCITMKATAQDLKAIPIPEGVKTQPISSAEIRTINSTFKFFFEQTEAYIQESALRFPSVYLVTEDGQHVGHMLGANDGTMEMLYVNPDFRRKGYAKVIVSQLAQKYFAQGEDAYVYIDDDHVASQNLHKSLGFREVEEVKLNCMMCD